MFVQQPLGSERFSQSACVSQMTLQQLRRAVNYDAVNPVLPPMHRCTQKQATAAAVRSLFHETATMRRPGISQSKRTAETLD